MPLLAVIAVMLVVACGGGSAAPAPSAADVGEVRLHQSGGFAGIDETVVVHADGTATVAGPVASRAGRTLADADLARLHALIVSDEFRSLKGTYVPAALCCDQFTYEVSAVVAGGTVTSATADGVPSPEVLQSVISLLNGVK